MIKSPSMGSLSTVLHVSETKDCKSFDMSYIKQGKRIAFVSASSMPLSPRSSSNNTSRITGSFSGLKISLRDTSTASRRKCNSQTSCMLDSAGESFGRGIRRVMSETDLQRIPRRKSHQSNFDINDHSSSNSLQSTELASQLDSSGPVSEGNESINSSSSRNENDNCSVGNMSEVVEYSRDDLSYTSLPGRALVCNSKGCKPIGMDDEDLCLFTSECGDHTEDNSYDFRNKNGRACRPASDLGSISGLQVIQAERHYRESLEIDPGNPLLLHNYARFLHEVEHNIQKAEEFYERAILANPGDGEVLSQYAKLIWDEHRDQERAASYFDRAIKASPDDCFVLAAFASFLWSIDSVTNHPAEENFPFEGVSVS